MTDYNRQLSGVNYGGVALNDGWVNVQYGDGNPGQYGVDHQYGAVAQGNVQSNNNTPSENVFQWQRI